MDFCVKDVPVSHEYDVLVAGSGMGGISAAVAAADVHQTTEDVVGSLSFFSSAAVAVMATTASAVLAEMDADAIPFSGS